MPGIKLLAVVAATALIQGCVSIKPPKGLVADTVEAGTDLYRTIKDERDSKDPDIFVSVYVGEKDMDPAQAASHCLDQAMQLAANELLVESVSATVIRESWRVEQDSLIADCKIKASREERMAADAT